MPSRFSPISRNWLSWPGGAALLILLCLLPGAAMAKPIPTALASYDSWPEETVETFRELLVFDQGRVKPVDTFARFTQLAFFGKRSVQFSTADGNVHKIDSTEWLLNVLFRPQVAVHIPTFVVNDSRAIEEIGVEPKKRRDRFSYNELYPGRADLAKKASEYAKQQAAFDEAKKKQSDKAAELELNRIQTMVLILGRNVSSFEYLGGQMAFAQQGEILSESLLPETMMTLAKSLDAMEVIERLPEMSMNDLVREMQATRGEAGAELLQMTLQLLFFYARSGDLIAFFPPPRGDYPAFEASDIRKPAELLARLQAGAKTDALSGYLWERIDDASRKSLEAEGQAEDLLRETLATALNTVIEGDLIYEKERFAAGSLENPTRELMDTDPEGDTLVELNRMLLNDYYRSELELPAKEWLSVGGIIAMALESEEMRPWARERLTLVQDLARSAAPEKADEFQANLEALRAFVDAEAKDRRIGDKAGLEVSFYKKNFFTNALVYFILGFILLSLSWLAPGSKFSRWLYIGVWAVTVIGLVYLTIGITMRCIIRERPPISNLYETIIFIAAICVLVGLFIEWVTKLRVGLASAVVLGLGLMFVSIRYEAKEATDTMGQLQAVLDTNFWLATHVTIINIGYAAGMLAAIVSHFWIVGRALGLSIEDKSLYRTITRMVYGIVCFCLLFSLVGTVLGGIWANDSWGRFWGWDPKENGALMICLFSLAMLHARMGGYIRDLGMHLSSIVLGIIVTFSWWGVNNLGVGLHSYGFTEGVWRNLFVFWGIEIVFMVIAVFANRRPLLNLGASRPVGKKVDAAGAAS